MHDHVRVAFSVAKYSTPYGERTGVATGWMQRLIDSSGSGDDTEMHCMNVSVRSGGSFRLPHELDRPLVLIGPGTGGAPFLGFLQERKFLSQVTHASTARSWSTQELCVELGCSCGASLALLWLSQGGGRLPFQT